MPALIGLALSICTVQAFADSGWYYDEDSDTVIYSNNQSAVTQPSSLSNNAVVQHSGSWYYDESNDYIVYNVGDSHGHSAQTITLTDTIGPDSNLIYLD